MTETLADIDFFAGYTLVIDKPLTWTSFDVVNKIRFALRRFGGIKKIKVGHAGTLDPLATGIVIVCIGKATKGIQALMDHDKEYVANIRIGQTTPSSDGETEVDATFPANHITRETVEKTLSESFSGEIMQVPPMHSAIRVDGHRAYEYARKGKADDIQLAARPITIMETEVLNFTPATDATPTADLDLRVACSKGTYIRSLARDLGTALGSGAYLTGLRRTRVGDHTIGEALTVDDAVDFIASHVIPLKADANKDGGKPAGTQPAQ